MQAQPDQPSRQTLSDRIQAAPPQELVSMLLVGARGFTNQAATAALKNDAMGRDHLVQRVGAIIEQLEIMLNYEEGGEVVDNLSRIYEWWLKELVDASSANDAARLQHVAQQMGTMSESWDQRTVA